MLNSKEPSRILHSSHHWACPVLSRRGAFVAENHVIVVELPIDYGHAAIYQFCSIIIRLIESKHRHHGHPNVSVALVRHVLEQSVTKTI